MRFVIGIGGRATPASGLSLAPRGGVRVLGLRDLAPSGLAAAGTEPSPLEIADAKARFEASGEDAVAVLGERRSWGILESLVTNGAASGLLIFDEPADYIARRIANGGDLQSAAADWTAASSRLLQAADACRAGARVVSSAEAAAAAEEFSYFCETQFGLPVDATASAPPALELTIALQYVAAHEELKLLAEELAARAETFGGREGLESELGEAALSDLAHLHEKAIEADDLRKDCAALTEQLRLVQYKAEAYFKAARGKEGGVSSAEKARLSAELEHARHEIAALKRSTSWKVSAPLRVVSRAVKKLANGKSVFSERKQISLLRNSDLFDADWYRQKYPDVAASRQDPARHFLRFGGAEGRSPSAKFDSAKYLKANPDVAAAGARSTAAIAPPCSRSIRN